MFVQKAVYAEIKKGFIEISSNSFASIFYIKINALAIQKNISNKNL